MANQTRFKELIDVFKYLENIRLRSVLMHLCLVRQGAVAWGSDLVRRDHACINITRRAASDLAGSLAPSWSSQNLGPSSGHDSSATRRPPPHGVLGRLLAGQVRGQQRNVRLRARGGVPLGLQALIMERGETPFPRSELAQDQPRRDFSGGDEAKRDVRRPVGREGNVHRTVFFASSNR